MSHKPGNKRFVSVALRLAVFIAVLLLVSLALAAVYLAGGGPAGMAWAALVVALAALVLAVLLALYIRKALAGHLGGLVNAAARLAGGDCAISELPDRRDELGAIADSLGQIAESVAALGAGAALISVRNSADSGAQVDTSALSGEYLEIALGINRALTVLDNLDSPVYVIDAETHNIVYMNRRTSAVFGSSGPETEIGGWPLLEADSSAGASIAREVLDPADTRWYAEQTTRISWVDGRPSYMVVRTDITTHKQMEMQQQEYALEMREMAARAEEAVATARDIERAKTAFLSTTSHEIRTPMNGILGFSDLALATDMPQKTREYVEKIKTSAVGLMDIINNILEISRVESGKAEVDSVPFSLLNLLSVCGSICSAKAKEKGLRLQVSAEPPLTRNLLGDPAKLRQVLLNLLTNAVKFTNKGSVSLTAEVVEDGNCATVRFMIEDSGIGMSPEQVRNIFEPFSPTDRNKKYGSTGLGLTIAKNFLELMGGELSVHSVPGEGSRFSFTLAFEMTDLPAESIPSAPALITAPKLTGRALVCDDNLVSQQVICEHLSRAGLEYEVAENGAVGVRMAQSSLKSGKGYDIVFMDIFMPEMDGVQATEELLSLGIDVPIIALTANAFDTDRDMYLKSGMTDYLGKPFSTQELWAVLLKYLKPTSPVETRAAVLDRAAGLKNVAGRQGLYEKILEDFANSHSSSAEEIRQALERGDLKKAHLVANSMKGVAGAIGARELAAAAMELEAVIKGGGDITASLSLFENVLHVVLGELSGGELE